MSSRADVRKDLSHLLPDLRALQYSAEGQVIIKYLRLKQDVLRMDLETAPLEEIHKTQGGLGIIREIIAAISG